MHLYESVNETDLKVNKALHKAKRSIMNFNAVRSPELRDKVQINAAGQEAIAADILSETIFLKTLIDEGLSGTLYSEESGVKAFGDPEVGDDQSIILLLDPLDGSANYMKGIPFGCISVAYGAYETDPVLSDLTTASIMGLYTEEEFFAEKGFGAHKNGLALQGLNQETANFDRNSTQLSYYAYGSKASKYYFDFQSKYSLRSLGSAAWELALVAEKRNDAFVDLRGVLKCHDFAAAKLILEEVGGKLQFLNISQKETDYLPLNDFRTGYAVVGALDNSFLNYLLDEFSNYDLLPAISNH